jgi:hypothetical protein
LRGAPWFVEDSYPAARRGTFIKVNYKSPGKTCWQSRRMMSIIEGITPRAHLPPKRKTAPRNGLSSEIHYLKAIMVAV